MVATDHSTRARGDPANERIGRRPARPIRAEARRKLLSAIAKGQRWLNEMISSKLEGTEGIAAREGISNRSTCMGLSLVFFAPDIVQAAVDGALLGGLGVRV